MTLENICYSGIDQSSPVSPAASDWAAHYDRSRGLYSAKLDWWTLSSWEKHLFSRLPSDLRGKLIADFGCGTSDRIASIYPMQVHCYRYVGVDSSLTALKRAARNFPKGFFVRGDVARQCLHPAAADIVLCLGVLMYFKDYVRVLDEFLSVLKPGGFLLLHEQVRRISWSTMLQSSSGRGHDGLPKGYGITWDELSDCLSKRGTILHAHFGGSPLRRSIYKFIDAVGSDSLNSVGTRFDSFWCATAGRIFPALGASELQILFRKT